MKILLVDDEKEFVSALAERLAFRGLEADWVSRPEDAVELAEKNRYDLAVLDVKMPRIGGIALKSILAEKHPGMKFIFLTGHGSGEDFAAGAAQAGADCYLAKPLRIERLLDRIRALGGSGEEEAR